MKYWFKVQHSPTGTTVTCTMQDGNMSVKATVKSYYSHVKEGTADAKARALKMMTDLKEAVGEDAA